MGFEKYLPLDAALDLPFDPNLHRWLAHLDLDFYRNHPHGGGVSDLKDLSDHELALHFMQRGFLEGRAYNPQFFAFLDPKDYAERYPELKLTDAAQALRHWMYHGVFEGRIPNKMTQDLVDADVHLFQMGKVASKSIEMALVQAGHRRLIPHLHWASEIVQTYTRSFLPYDAIINRDPHKKLVFISGVRDPIERIVSGLFQSASERKSSLGVADLAALFEGPRERLDAFLMPHLQLVLDWFSHGYFRGIDVYEHPFDAARGYACIRKGPVTVFVYRLDALDRCWAPLSELLGLPLAPATTNEAQSKGYGAQMRQALQHLRAAPHGALHEAVRASRYWQHFFADAPTAQARGVAPALSASPNAPRAAGPLPQAHRASTPVASDVAAQPFAGRWVRIDLAVRTSLRPPPVCRLRLDCSNDTDASDLAAAPRSLVLHLDGDGALRFFLRLPASCERIAVEPADPHADFRVLRFSIRARSFNRVLFDVLRFEWAADRLTLARRLWRAVRAARVHGWSSLGGSFLDNLERNIPGYGFLRASHARMPPRRGQQAVQNL